jgi:hypothetical protein
MKIKTLLILSVLAMFPICLMAQTNVLTNAPPTDGSLPSTTSDFWKYAIAVVVPLVVGGFKKLAPNIPTWLLPVSTPFVGIALGAALKWLGASHMGWVDMAQAGAMAVMVRESFNQIVTQRMSGSSTPK